MERTVQGTEQMHQLAHEFMQSLRTSNVVALIGDLGAGKTTFVQEIGKYLQITEDITSPTFLLMKVHRVSGHPDITNLIHLDLYRIESWDEISMLGLEELWQNPKNLVCIEWAERIKINLPKDTQYVYITHKSENERIVKIT